QRSATAQCRATYSSKSLFGREVKESQEKRGLACLRLDIHKQRNVTALPLHDELQSLTDSPTIDRLLVDNDDSARCEEILEYAFTLYLQGAQESVQKDPPAALDAFWHALVEFDRKSRSFRGDPRQSMAAVNAGRAVQILHGCLFGVGEIVLDPLYKVSSQRLQQFLNRFWDLASSAAVLAPAVENL